LDKDKRKSLDPFREIWINLANNQRYSIYVSQKDIEVFRDRVESEGLNFLTCTLPNIGKALDTYHAIGVWESPVGFKTDGNGVPRFLGQAIKAALGGQFLAVDCVRQLSLMFYKLEVPYDSGLVDRFLVDFESIDQELGNIDLGVSYALLDIAQADIYRLLKREIPTDIRPCHGSGATACHTLNHEKWHRLRYFPKLDDTFSYPDYFFYSPTHLSDELGKLEEAVIGVPTARVCLVPKDSRGPRVISCEPAELMYIQQGLMRKLYRITETHYLTRGRVNFADQEINKRLAREASKTGALTTLDLSEASDRVSLDLVKRLFPPDWVEAFEACRSESTELPNGKVIKLNKFAPMGSACCFPVEAIIFYFIALASIQLVSDTSPDVYVYGDDIIVPTNFAGIVIEGLERVGLKVNRSKTFSQGPFRESCGGDYYLGNDVTPIRVRNFFATSNSSIVTDADFCNLLIAKFGYTDAISAISVVEELYGHPFPRSSMPHPGVLLVESRASNDCFFRRRFNLDLQRYEHRIPGIYVQALACHEPSWSELLRKELTRDIRDNDSPDKYVSPLRDYEATLEPGYYAAAHAARATWTWVWLG